MNHEAALRDQTRNYVVNLEARCDGDALPSKDAHGAEPGSFLVGKRLPDNLCRGAKRVDHARQSTPVGRCAELEYGPRRINPRILRGEPVCQNWGHGSAACVRLRN